VKRLLGPENPLVVICDVKGIEDAGSELQELGVLQK
jgi:hypothetical protein